MNEKAMWIFKRACKEDNQFLKEKGKVINKKGNAKICHICKEKLENTNVEDEKGGI